MQKSGPTPQFISSINAALAYFKRMEEAGDIARLIQERHNLNQVIKLGLSRPETCISTLEALIGSYPMVVAQGFWQEGQETFEKAIAVCPEDRIDLKVNLLGKYGELQRNQGRLNAAVVTHNAELSLARQLDDPLLIGRAHVHLTHDFRQMHQFEQAQQQGKLALSALEQSGEQGLPFTASVFNALGRIARQQGDRPEAEIHLRQVVAIQRQLDNQVALAEGLHDLGLFYQEDKQVEQALRCYEEAEQLLADDEQVNEHIRLQNDIGILHFNQQNYPLAEKAFRGIDLDYLHQTGNLAEEARIFNNIGNAVLYQQRYEEAANLLRNAVALYRQLEDSIMLANATGSLGEALAGQGQQEMARQHFREALTLLEPFSDLPLGKRLITLFSKELNKLDQSTKELRPVENELDRPDD